MDGFPGLHAQGRTPTFATSPAPGSCSPRRTLSSAIRHPQRPDARLGPAMAGPNFYRGQYEFQCLHGMGEPLYEEVVGRDKLDRPCRVYAPVGSHETLLAYLVRRLLENGANTSFVNRIADASVSVDELVADPGRARAAHSARRRAARADRARRATSTALTRVNSRGLDVPTKAGSRRSRDGLEASARARRRAFRRSGGGRAGRTVRQPRRSRDVVGHVVAPARADEVAAAIDARGRSRARLGGAHRRTSARRSLRRAADAFEADDRRPDRAHRARGRQDLRQRASPRCARRSISCATTPPKLPASRPRDAPPARASSPASALEFPARDLHRTGCRGARRRQCGDRQARRGNAADRGRGGPPPARRRRPRRRARAPPRRRRGRRRDRRTIRASQGVVFTGSTEVARLIASAAREPADARRRADPADRGDRRA